MSTGPYSILYVDDENINLELFKTIFRRFYTLFVASSAVEGLEILEKNKIDLIITDEKMPGMTGIEFLKEVNQRFPSLPPYRIITSAYTKPAKVDEAFAHYKLYKFVPKPWKISELRNIVKEVLEQ
jgi:CheY-like chemotaxis protein